MRRLMLTVLLAAFLCVMTLGCEKKSDMEKAAEDAGKDAQKALDDLQK